MPRSGTGISMVSPLTAHLCHLEHLGRPASARLILRSRFGFSKSDCDTYSKTLASFVRRGVDFIEDSERVSPSIRPMLQYYGFLNLAVATVIAWRPKNWTQYRSHGASDKTDGIRRLGITSKVVSMREFGAIQLFHSVISDSVIAKEQFSLKELLVSIPFVEVELREAHSIRTSRTVFRHRIDDAGGNQVRSVFEFELNNEPDNPKAKMASQNRLLKAIPVLATDFERVLRGPQKLVFRSKRAWAKDRLQEAREWHWRTAFKASNFSAYQTSYCWQTEQSTRILPTLTSCLLICFVLSSISRYRPYLVGWMDDARLNILFDVFSCEVTSLMVPAFRNLLYREEFRVGPTSWL